MPIDVSVLPSTVTITPMSISLEADKNFSVAVGTPVPNIKALFSPHDISEDFIITGDIPLMEFRVFMLPTVVVKDGYKIVDEDGHEYRVKGKPVIYKCPVDWTAHHQEVIAEMLPDSI